MSRKLEVQLKVARNQAISKMKNLCDNKLSQLASDYPEREAQTWPVQLEEAKSYLADSASPTPFISAALNDGETVEQYANLIVANNAAWSDYAGSIVKMRRDFEAAINSAQNIEDLMAIINQMDII